MADWGPMIGVGAYLALVAGVLGLLCVKETAEEAQRRMAEERMEEARIRRLVEQEERRRIERQHLRTKIEGTHGDLAVFLSILFPGFGEALLSPNLDSSGALNYLMTRVRIVSFPIAGALLGGSLGFVLRPTNPLVGQLPLGTVITRGAFLEGMDRLIVPLAEYSFNAMLGGLLAGAAAGALIAYLMQQPRLRTGAPQVSSAEATKVCPFCAEAIKVAANVCRFCGHNLAEDIARSDSEASTSEDPER